jgi:hypothetical protein
MSMLKFRFSHMRAIAFAREFIPSLPIPCPFSLRTTNDKRIDTNNSDSIWRCVDFCDRHQDGGECHTGAQGAYIVLGH